jgi:predicted TIM-barrel fold metal-dependent hydrolase
MADHELLDCHIHCFPSEEDGRFFMDRMVGWKDHPWVGTLEQVLAIHKKAGITRANVLMYTPARLYYEDAIAALPSKGSREEAIASARRSVVRRIESNNDWCVKLIKEHPRFRFFCGVDVTFMTEEEMLRGIERWMANGARGVKIVPQGMRIYGDDPRLLPLFDYCQSNGIPVLSQSGGRPPSLGIAYAVTDRFAVTLRKFPKLKFIFAHMAHFDWMPNGGADALAEIFAACPNTYADLSLQFGPIARGERTREAMVALIRRLGADRILFGTNFPLADSAEAADVYRSLSLTESERQRVSSQNFLRVIARK